MFFFFERPDGEQLCLHKNSLCFSVILYLHCSASGKSSSIFTDNLTQIYSNIFKYLALEFIGTEFHSIFPSLGNHKRFRTRDISRLIFFVLERLKCYLVDKTTHIDMFYNLFVFRVSASMDLHSFLSVGDLNKVGLFSVPLRSLSAVHSRKPIGHCLV